MRALPKKWAEQLNLEESEVRRRLFGELGMRESLFENVDQLEAALLGFIKGDGCIMTINGRIYIGLSTCDISFLLFRLLPLVGGLGYGARVYLRTVLTALRRAGARRLPTTQYAVVLELNHPRAAQRAKDLLGGGSKDRLGNAATMRAL